MAVFEITKVDLTICYFNCFIHLLRLYFFIYSEKVEKATIRNRHNRLPHLVLNPKWGRRRNKRRHLKQSKESLRQEVDPFTADGLDAS